MGAHLNAYTSEETDRLLCQSLLERFAERYPKKQKMVLGTVWWLVRQEDCYL
ncbi:Mitochondrial-processing peptidase subunit beta [Apodemus speciosus]|uniref:Mitochondrial-processing peptidase subunit beta n=1 Tax=Apodemus speciosus TaxID=105296 RepID=A0ABQ0ERJ5_APOSI